MVFVATPGDWFVFALRESTRPAPDTKLQHAPHFNVWAGGRVCTGNVSLPKVVDHVRRELGNPLLTDNQICKYSGIATSLISRARRDLQPIQQIWLLRLREMSGIGIDELRAVANLPCIVVPYESSRRPRKQHLVPTPPINPNPTARRFGTKSINLVLPQTQASRNERGGGA